MCDRAGILILWVKMPDAVAENIGVNIVVRLKSQCVWRRVTNWRRVTK